MTEIEILTAFLAKHDLADMLDTLKTLKTTSLTLLKMLWEDATPEGLTKLKTKLKENGIPYAEERLARINAATIDAAIKDAKKDALTPSAVDDAARLDAFLVSAPSPVQELAAFLRTRGIARLTFLDVLLSESIESLEELKAVKEDSRAGGRLSKLRKNIEDAEVSFKAELKAFDSLSVSSINAAIENAQAARQTAEAKELETYLASASEDVKRLASFLKKNNLGTLKVVKVFVNDGVVSLDGLKVVRDDAAKWEKLGQKIDASGVPMARTFFDKLTAWAIAAAIDEAKQPSAEKAAARRKALDQAISAVEKLRKDLHDSTQAKFDENKTKMEAAYNEIVKQLDTYDIDFGMAEKGVTRDALNVLFQNTIESVRNTKNLLDGVEKQARTLEEAIVMGDMLKAFLIHADGIDRMNSDLILMPEMTSKVRKDPGAYRSETISYKSSSRASFAVSSASKVGSNLAVSGQASAGGYVGSGIAAVSVAASYADAELASAAESKFQSDEKAQCGEIHYIYDPRLRLHFEDVRFSDGAAKTLDEIAAISAEEKRSRVLKFYDTFGSHFFREYTLGGRYQFTATGTSHDTRKKGSLQEAVLKTKDWAVSASASYKGLNGAGSVAAAVISSDTKANASAAKYDVYTSDATVTVATEVLGGAPAVPRDVWALSLQYSSTWRVIERGVPLAVWEMIKQDKKDPVRNMAGLFEEVWVQEVFPGGGIEKQYPGLRKYLKEKTIKTCKQLFDALPAYKPEKPVAPECKISAVESKSVESGKPKARASNPDPAYKLIGGGAKVIWTGSGSKGPGLMLTGSYPDGITWVAEAKEHQWACNGTATAYAIYLHDPEDLWDVQRIEVTSTGISTHLSTVTATLTDGYVLTGGGARADGINRLLTKSYPGMDCKSWTAECKDHGIAEVGQVTAWVIGIKPRNGAKLAPSIVNSQSTTGNFPLVELGSGANLLIGGGAAAKWEVSGGLLTKSCPDFTAMKWLAQAKDHGVKETVRLDVYTISRPVG